MRKPTHQDPDAVYEARDRADMTQQQLADLVGCSKSLICEIEYGTRNAGPERLKLIAKVLKVPVSTLRAQSEPRRPATPTAAVGVQPVRHEERAGTEDLPQLRGNLTGGAA
jgi:transcriptional regulator with XRE-family HTH domain